MKDITQGLWKTTFHRNICLVPILVFIAWVVEDRVLNGPVLSLLLETSHEEFMASQAFLSLPPHTLKMTADTTVLTVQQARFQAWYRGTHVALLKAV